MQQHQILNLTTCGQISYRPNSGKYTPLSNSWKAYNHKMVIILDMLKLCDEKPLWIIASL